MFTDKILAIILGGGKGTRLYPLTKHRCKPAISFGGKYRLIDIPISNCINSRITQIYVLTQFLTTSIHRHIFETYRMDITTRGFVDILPAEQTLTDSNWYQGTADAVRRASRSFKDMPFEDILILSGDQLCSMDFVPMYEYHKAKDADLTIIGHPISYEETHRMGVIQSDKSGQILQLIEKPRDKSLIKGFEDSSGNYVASTGNYFFKKKFLMKVLSTYQEDDFGKKIIPASIKDGRAFLHMFNGYWEDIGTISSFFKANLDLAKPIPEFNMYDNSHRILTHPRFLPAAKIQHSQVIESLISEGCIIQNAVIHKAVIGIRSVIEANTRIREAIVLGNDFYSQRVCDELVEPKIGSNVVIEQAIIDKNVVLEDDVIIRGNLASGQSYDADLYSVRDGIVVVSKGTRIPKRTVIEVK